MYSTNMTLGINELEKQKIMWLNKTIIVENTIITW
jgi:hypothetical protein